MSIVFEAKGDPSHFTFRDFQSSLGIPFRNIDSEMTRVRNGEWSLIQEEDDSKVRQNIIAAHATEQMWRVLHNKLQERSSSCGFESAQVKTLDSEIPSAHFDHAIALLHKEALILLKECLRKSLDDAQERLMQRAEDDWSPSDHINRMLFAYRFSEHTTLSDIIEWALDNALSMDFASVGVIPKLNNDDNLSSQKYEAISKRNIRFIHDLARSHLQLFGYAKRLLLKKGVAEKSLAFDPQYFQMVPTKNEPFLALKGAFRNVLNDVMKEKIEGVATGCAALYARSPKGKDTITDLHILIMNICRKFLFPHLKSLLSSRT
ncbi:hypothetical protein A3C37_05535 [Candidatus Peribacteria bacterium RIFCSPHIGHO2_02_FULL_53_20]|nr:MAG: hypothetical protein A3C37_05535 [Candidatus Peribacteria bacterium RIFCSPHIGHO2_02_FULL_53_20]OGJ66674.1 MAG: hypothetical protein A3B61_04980 [Candidatus Peribacteria bacterium RIFCSPLOWO2_01_FULL_53_10]OGJ69613.1 MAG: hypothetical protein A3G69_01425 [Candidatus Peribacteria bacterium RIFCSPLOWO2_12_FULL_53_10]HLC66625.1 hypothetical protein [Candidatus Nanoarchaeia archaeon]